MPQVIYHLLPEAEPFSESRGGAISRWAGNALRDDGQTRIVCPSADGTWPFASESLLLLPQLGRYRRARRRLQQISRARIGWTLHRALLRRLFEPLLRRVRHGDIVWIHNRPEFALALTPALHRAGAQVVLHMHNSHLLEWPRTLLERVRVDRILFVSQFLLDEAQRKFPRLPRAEVLYNGADGVIFHPAKVLAGQTEANETTSPVVLFAGRLVEDKGVHVLVDSMRLLAEQGVALRAWIVGGADFSGGQQTEYIERLKAAAPETVSFLPYRTGASLGELFRQADIFCSPSIWDEPFGLVNVEALASGLPVVSTRVGGVPEVFREGGGILVERGSSEELAGALRLLAQDGQLRTELARQGYETFTRRFTWTVARSRVHEVLRSLPV